VCFLRCAANLPGAGLAGGQGENATGRLRANSGCGKRTVYLAMVNQGRMRGVGKQKKLWLSPGCSRRRQQCTVARATDSHSEAFKYKVSRRASVVLFIQLQSGPSLFFPSTTTFTSLCSVLGHAHLNIISALFHTVSRRSSFILRSPFPLRFSLSSKGLFPGGSIQ